MALPPIELANIVYFLSYFLFLLLSPQLVNGCTTGVVRLVGSTYTYQGRVEICVNNTWGTVCDRNFGRSDARVVCRQLGYSSASTNYDSTYFGQGTGPIWLDDLSCSGSELTLLQCSHRQLGSNDCSHGEDVSVRCTGSKTGSCTNGDVRLVGGPNSTSGRVEVCAYNQWGTVCDDYWDNNDAKVVCSMLNSSSSSAIARGSAYFGEGSGSILLDNVQCTGNEVSIFSCSHNSIESHDCSHSSDAGVVCIEGCVTGVVRLVGSTYTYQGRVEICVNNAWGTVCDDNFGSSDAGVVCRQLGYSSGYTYYSSTYYGQGTGQIWLDDLSCSGSELTLLQCSHRGIGSNNCDHSDDVSVRCSGSKTGSCTNGDVRLVGGPNSTSGRVEVCANNQWGTVCDDYWDNDDAKIVCRMLNYPSSDAIARGSGYFGEGSGSILLDNVQCTGNEVSIFSCTHNMIGSNDCSHNDDAGVVCLGLIFSLSSGETSSSVIGPVVGGILGGVVILFIIIVIISSVICWYKHIGICAKLHGRKKTCTIDINQNDEVEVDTLDQQLMKTQFMKLEV